MVSKHEKIEITNYKILKIILKSKEFQFVKSIFKRFLNDNINTTTVNSHPVKIPIKVENPLLAIPLSSMSLDMII